MKNLFYRLFSISLLVFLLAACAPGRIPVTGSNNVQFENPYPPQASDSALVRDTVRVVKTEISSLNSTPAKFELKISFFLPTPCDQYRLIASQPGADKRINVEVYSLMVKDKPCTLMALSTPTEVSLTIGGLPAGHYSVYINDEKGVEFDA
jgi:hypothetical protein